MLTAIAALGSGTISFTGDSSLCSRGMQPLIDALQGLQVKVQSAPGGHAPLSVQGPIRSGNTQVEAMCSQYLSSLLFAAPGVPGNGIDIEVTRLSEEPYVKITLDWLNKLKAQFTATDDLMHFSIPGNQTLQAFDTVIPADFSTAAFPLGAGILAGSCDGVTIKNLDFNDAQGDKAVFAMLESLGARLLYNNDNSVTVLPGSRLHSGELDLGQTPDALPLLAAVAAATPGAVIKLGNAAQARNKETDRITCMTRELRKMGAIIEELPDAMIITGTKLSGATVDSCKDHRLAMALAVAALTATSATQILDAESCAVTYPDFIKDFQQLGADFTLA
jgi:3-phosphoshikimate 1-carboxyvinyltransferase